MHAGQLSGAAATFQFATRIAAEVPEFQVRYVFSKKLDEVFLGLFVSAAGHISAAELGRFVRNARGHISETYLGPDAGWSAPETFEPSKLSPYFARRAILVRSYRLADLPEESVLLQQLGDSIVLLSELASAVAHASAAEIQLWFGSNLASSQAAPESAARQRVRHVPKREPKLVKVWFGTNRRPIVMDDGTLDLDHPDGPFGTEDSEVLSFGACTVSIPESHRFGGRRSWLEKLRRGGDDLRLEGVVPFDSGDEFVKDVKSKLHEIPEDQKRVLVYIHGYNVTFREAATRAAQLGTDLNVPIAAFYSWPSSGTTAGYLSDSAAIEASEPMLIEFLRTLAKVADSSPIHLLVHSMGNRGLVRVLEQLSILSRTDGFKFGQIILAAPDVDARVFRQRASGFACISARTTLYVSRKDYALEMSRSLSCFPRAGLCPPVTVVPGVDTIEVTKIDVSLLGHGYYRSAEPVLYDMADLFNRGAPPSNRIRLSPIPDLSTARYWFIRE